MRRFPGASAVRALILVAVLVSIVGASAGCGEGPPVPHTLEGRSDCLACHGEGGVKPYPDNHTDRSVEKCLDCHEAG